MIVQTSTVRAARRRRLGEVVGHVNGLHELHDKCRIGVRLVSRDADVHREMRCDRTRYFAFRRVPPGTYELRCDGVFGGVYNEIVLGSVRVDRSVTLIHASADGAVLVGSVLGCGRPTPRSARMELARQDGTGGCHVSLLDKFSRFFFGGLSRGEYILNGHIPGRGRVAPVGVLLSEGTTRLPAVQMEPAPTLRIRVRDQAGRSVLRRFRVNITRRDGRDYVEGFEKQEGELVIERPADCGAQYRVQLSGGAPVVGRFGDGELNSVATLEWGRDVVPGGAR